jgi:hypothetical protein
MSVEIMLNAVNLLFVAFSTYHQDAQGQISFFSMAVAAAEVAVGLAILVSIFRNLGSIDINNLKKLKGYNEYKFSFTFIISSFIGFLFNVFFGTSENQLLESLEPLLFSLLFGFSLFLRTLLLILQSNFTFRLDSNQQFQGRFWFSIRPIIHFMVTVCNRNWFVNSYVLYQHA